jgi:hypothetical protein
VPAENPIHALVYCKIGKSRRDDFVPLHALASPFNSQVRLEAEIVLLRHQLNLLRRRQPARPRLTPWDRLLFVWLYRLMPSLLNAAVIIQPDTIVRWHRAGFRSYWRWKSRSRGGRPKVAAEVRSLIRRMSLENSLWGAPRIHGELLKLGIEVAQSTVAKYMAKRRPGSGQTWRTFLRNHVAGTVDHLVGYAADCPRGAHSGDSSQCRHNHEYDGHHQENQVNHSLPLTGSGYRFCSFDHIVWLDSPLTQSTGIATFEQRAFSHICLPECSLT